MILRERQIAGHLLRQSPLVQALFGEEHEDLGFL